MVGHWPELGFRTFVSVTQAVIICALPLLFLHALFRVGRSWLSAKVTPIFLYNVFDQCLALSIFHRIARSTMRLQIEGGMARKFWQKRTIMLIAIIFLWSVHTHEVNKQVRSFAEDKIDMSDGRGVGLYHPLRRYSSCLAHAEFSNMCGRVRDRVARKTTFSPSLFLLAFKRASQST